MSALVTEHFALQSSAAATISESASRSSLYLLSLSSSLVALGFATETEGVFAPFAAAVLPTLFVVGCFTVVRLVDTSIENILCLRGIARIHRHYAELVPEGPEFFGRATDDAAVAKQMTGTRASNRTAVLFTMASMIAAVNSVLGGTAVTLLLAGALGIDRGLAIGAGVLAALALFAAAYAYEQRRFRTTLGAPTSP